LPEYLRVVKVDLVLGSIPGDPFTLTQEKIMALKVTVVFIHLKHPLIELLYPTIPWLTDGAMSIGFKLEKPEDSEYLDNLAEQLTDYHNAFTGKPVRNCLVLKADKQGNTINIPFSNIAAFVIGREGEPKQE
jgi:hypothetical protein